MEIDHEALARDLVRVLRGHRSQVQLSRRLGFATNTVYSWESGRRWPSASRFVHIAERVGAEPGVRLARFVGAADPYVVGSEQDASNAVVAFLQACRGERTIGTIAERTGHSRFAVSRWLRGQSEPRLPDFLQMIEATTLRLLDFVALFCDPATLRSVDEEWAQLQRARDSAWDAPWTQGVLLALTLPGYRGRPHDPELLAAALGIEVQVVNRCLVHLEQSGQARWDGERWAPVAVQAVDLRRPGSGTALKRHWMQVAADRLEAPVASAVEDARPLYSYNVFTVGGPALEELKRMQRAHYRAVRSFVAEAPPGDRVVLMHLQLVPLGQAQP